MNFNSIKRVALGLIVLLLLGSWILHKFYVSLTEIQYNAGSNRFEVSMRIFPDDLDLAFENRFGIATHLLTELEHTNADSLIQAYLEFHFTLEVDGDPVIMHYLGKEAEADAIWCYLESEPIKDPVSILVRNSILTNEFEDQVNIIQVYSGKWNKGLLLTREHISDQLTIGR
ncbi:MAG: DUF6702 family protein [Bacteroidota bacterium]